MSTALMRSSGPGSLAPKLSEIPSSGWMWMTRRLGCTLASGSRRNTRFGVERHRRLHRDQAEELQDVVLDHVAERARLLVVRAARLHSDRLAHRDLHVGHVVPVPERLEDAVGEAHDQDVLHRLLAEVVV